MAKSLYLFRAGRLRRQQNTLLFEGRPPDSEKRFLPIAEISDIYAMAPLRFNTDTLRFLGEKGVPLHVFSHYGHYRGTFWPRPRHLSGELVVSQVAHYKALPKRLRIAQEFVLGAAHHIRKNLLYYHNRGLDLSQPLAQIEARLERLPAVTTIADLMGEEGKIRAAYYSAWQAILELPAPFTRERRPPYHPPQCPPLLPKYAPLHADPLRAVPYPATPRHKLFASAAQPAIFAVA